MSVEDAITSYGTLAGTVFTNVKQAGGGGMFDATELEKAIKKIVNKQTKQDNECMLATHGNGCKA